MFANSIFDKQRARIEWSCRGTIQCSMASYTNHLYMKLTHHYGAFAEQPTVVLTLWVSVKINGITNLTPKLIFKT